MLMTSITPNGINSISTFRHWKWFKLYTSSRYCYSTMSASHTCFVSSEWLFQNLDKVQVVDASWRFSPDGRHSSFYEEFLQERTPKSRYFDIEEAVTKDSRVPHLLPSPQQFASYVGTRLGISDKDTIVIYSRPHLVGAARVWWMFRVFGMPKDQCFILKGGLEEWKKHGYPLASGPIEEKESIHSKTFVPKFQSQLVADRLQVKDSLKSGTAIILDARSAGRFYGTEPEPRQGVPSGHIEKAMSLPFVQLLTKDGQELLPKEDLMKVFENHGIDIKTNQKIICMCGSGVTATVVHLALDQLNVFTSCVYDGSWMDWTMKGEKE